MAVITPRPLLGVGFVRIRGCFESAIRRSRGVQRGVQGEFILGCSVGAELRNLGCSTLSHFNLTHTTKTTSSSKSFLPPRTLAPSTFFVFHKQLLLKLRNEKGFYGEITRLCEGGVSCPALMCASIVLFCLEGGLLRCRQGVVNSRQARRPPLLPYNRARQGDGASDAGQLRPGHESDQPVATEEGVLRLTRPNPRKPIASSGHDPQGSRLYGPATKGSPVLPNYGRIYGRRTVAS